MKVVSVVALVCFLASTAVQGQEKELLQKWLAVEKQMRYCHRNLKVTRQGEVMQISYSAKEGGAFRVDCEFKNEKHSIVSDGKTIDVEGGDAWEASLLQRMDELADWPKNREFVRQLGPYIAAASALFPIQFLLQGKMPEETDVVTKTSGSFETDTIFEIGETKSLLEVVFDRGKNGTLARINVSNSLDDPIIYSDPHEIGSGNWISTKSHYTKNNVEVLTVELIPDAIEFEPEIPDELFRIEKEVAESAIGFESAPVPEPSIQRTTIQVVGTLTGLLIAGAAILGWRKVRRTPTPSDQPTHKSN